MRKISAKTALAALALALAAAAAAPGAAFAQPAQTPPGQPGPRGPERMFQQLDANSDGRVTREEALAWVATRFGQADADRDGALSLAEFQAVQGPRGDRPDRPASGPQGADPSRWAERRAAMFRALDANADGRLTQEEVRPAVEARFRAADANGDGAVTREELPQRHAHRGNR
jgi:Ca2+-binding EF-hand superfamily protein